MPDAIVLPGAGGRTGETLLILGILGAGAFVLWRRGAFAAPSAPVPTATRAARPARAPAPSWAGSARDPALPAASTVQAVPSVSLPLTDAQKNVAQKLSSEGRTAENLFPVAQASAPAPSSVRPSSFQSTADAIASNRMKPGPVSSPVGTTSSALMTGPSPFGKPLSPVKRPQVAAPQVMAAPPVLAAPKPAPLVAPVLPSSGGGKFGSVTSLVNRLAAAPAAAAPPPPPAKPPSLPMLRGIRF